MAQTFLISKSFEKSAKYLNGARLHNQKVEGMQILTIINHYRLLADYLNIEQFPSEVETKIEERTAWMNKVMDAFKKLGCEAIHIQMGNYRKIYPGSKYPIKKKSKSNLIIKEGQVIETTKSGKTVLSQGPIENYVLPNDEYITLPNGFSQHPVVKMWLGFETALKAYINAHIDVWVNQGKENNMVKYIIPKEYKRPEWTKSKRIISNYRAALVQKEIEGKEVGHYLQIKKFFMCWAISDKIGEEVWNYLSSLPRTLKITPGKPAELIFEWWESINPEILIRYGKNINYIWC